MVLTISFDSISAYVWHSIVIFFWMQSLIFFNDLSYEVGCLCQRHPSRAEFVLEMSEGLIQLQNPTSLDVFGHVFFLLESSATITHVLSTKAIILFCLLVRSIVLFIFFQYVGDWKWLEKRSHLGSWQNVCLLFGLVNFFEVLIRHKSSLALIENWYRPYSGKFT